MCIHTCAYTHPCAHTQHVHTHMCIHTHPCAYTAQHTHTHIHVHTQHSTRTHTYMCTHAHTCVHTRSRARTACGCRWTHPRPRPTGQSLPGSTLHAHAVHNRGKAARHMGYRGAYMSTGGAVCAVAEGRGSACKRHGQQAIRVFASPKKPIIMGQTNSKQKKAQPHTHAPCPLRT